MGNYQSTENHQVLGDSDEGNKEDTDPSKQTDAIIGNHKHSRIANAEGNSTTVVFYSTTGKEYLPSFLENSQNPDDVMINQFFKLIDATELAANIRFFDLNNLSESEKEYLSTNNITVPNKPDIVMGYADLTDYSYDEYIEQRENLKNSNKEKNELLDSIDKDSSIRAFGVISKGDKKKNAKVKNTGGITENGVDVEIFGLATLPKENNYPVFFVIDDQFKGNLTGFGKLVMVHEFGHTLGFDHPHDNQQGSKSYPKNSHDHGSAVMSYNEYDNSHIQQMVDEYYPPMNKGDKNILINHPEFFQEMGATALEKMYGTSLKKGDYFKEVLQNEPNFDLVINEADEEITFKETKGPIYSIDFSNNNEQAIIRHLGHIEKEENNLSFPYFLDDENTKFSVELADANIINIPSVAHIYNIPPGASLNIDPSLNFDNDRVEQNHLLTEIHLIPSELNEPISIAGFDINKHQLKFEGKEETTYDIVYNSEKGVINIYSNNYPPIILSGADLSKGIVFDNMKLSFISNGNETIKLSNDNVNVIGEVNIKNLNEPIIEPNALEIKNKETDGFVRFVPEPLEHKTSLMTKIKTPFIKAKIFVEEKLEGEADKNSTDKGLRENNKVRKHLEDKHGNININNADFDSAIKGFAEAGYQVPKNSDLESDNKNIQYSDEKLLSKKQTELS